MRRSLQLFRRPSLATLPSRWRPSRLRRVVGRPSVWWGAAIVVALLTVLTTARLVTQAADEREAWGTTRTVMVTSEVVMAGEALGPANTMAVSYPVAVLPRAFLDELSPGAIAAVSFGVGEIVSPNRVLGVDNKLSSRVAMAVPTGDLTGLVGVGDRVDVWVGTDPFLTQPGDEPSTRLVAGSPVIELTDTTALVAVADTEVAGLAAALPYGVVTLTIVGRG